MPITYDFRNNIITVTENVTTDNVGYKRTQAVGKLQILDTI